MNEPDRLTPYPLDSDRLDDVVVNGPISMFRFEMLSETDAYIALYTPDGERYAFRVQCRPGRRKRLDFVLTEQHPDREPTT